MHDRIRARPPPTATDDWTEGVVRHVERDGSGYVVHVAPDGRETTTEVTVTEAIYDLFTGRLDRPVDTPADVAGATVWFR